MSSIAEQLTNERAEDRIGERVDVLIEELDGDTAEGRSACQGPDVDGSTTVRDVPANVRVGDIVAARVIGSDGVDLIAAIAETAAIVVTAAVAAV